MPWLSIPKEDSKHFCALLLGIGDHQEKQCRQALDEQRRDGAHSASGMGVVPRGQLVSPRG